MEPKKEKTSLRPAPCPGYDIVGLESWLGDMAREGLVLKKHGTYLCFFSFCKTTPQNRTYRLEAAAQKTFDDANNMPPDDVVALYHDLGWEYVARYQNFYIYCTDNAATRELNTDPTLHALTLNIVKKRQIAAAFPPLFQIMLCVFLARNELLWTTLQLGSLFVLCCAVLYFYWFFCAIFEIAHLASLRKKLREQGELNHHKNWKRTKMCYLLRSCLSWVAVVILALWFWQIWQMDSSGARTMLITEYDQTPPFASLINLLGDEDGANYTYAPQDVIENSNTIKQWQDPLAPCNIEWTETAIVTQDSTAVLDAYYSVSYHQLATPWLAQQLAKEYSSRVANGFSREEPFVLEHTPEADYFASYDIYLGVSFIIQQGDKVAYVTFWNIDSTTAEESTAPFTIEECAETIAQSLRW